MGTLNLLLPTQFFLLLLVSLFLGFECRPAFFDLTLALLLLLLLSALSFERLVALFLFFAELFGLESLFDVFDGAVVPLCHLLNLRFVFFLLARLTLAFGPLLLSFQVGKKVVRLLPGLVVVSR